MENTWVHENTKLVSYEIRHDQKTVEWLQDLNLKKSFGLTNVPTIIEHRQWMDSLRNSFVWAIYDIDVDRHCGNVILFVNPTHYSASFQIYIGELDSRGKGIAKNALFMILKFAFDNLKLNRMWLHVFPENDNAISLYEHLGFIKEGIERQSHYHNSHFRNQFRYSMLRSEWEARKEDISR